MSSFSLLPNEIILKIFSLVDKRELVCSLSRVSRKWQQLAWDPQLWQNLSFNGPFLNLHQVCALLDKSPQIRRLHVMERDDAGAIIQHLIISENCTRMEYIALKQCHDYLDGELLVELVNKCTKLKQINLKDTQFYGKTFFLELGKLNFLRSINLGLNYSFKMDDLNTLANTCKQIEELSILSTSMFDKYRFQKNNSIFQSTFEKLSPYLKVLKINAIGLDDLSIKSISGCPKLVTLHLHRAVKVTKEGVKHLIHLTLLENLLISTGIKIKSEGWHTLFSLGNFQNINSLFLMRNRHLDDYTLILIKQRCPLLRRISLLNCRSITDLGVTMILQSCRFLNYLNVDGTHHSVCKALKKTLPFSVEKLEKIVVGNFFLDINEINVNPNLKILRNIHEAKKNIKKRKLIDFL